MKRSLIWVLIIIPLFAQTQDVKGSTDHAVVSRFKGAIIKDYNAQKFNALRLFLSPAKSGGGSNKTLDTEGKVTAITYLNPKSQTLSTLEVFRNFEQALVTNGFEPLFRCNGEQCGSGGDFSRNFPFSNWYTGHYKEQRFMAAKRADANGTVFLNLWVVQTGDGIVTRLEIAESATMNTGQVTVSAAVMANDLKTKGKVVLYGIYFDSGKAIVKPESASMLIEIARLLKENATLKVFVVGHTDHTGSFESNLDLSAKRAQAIVEELTGKYNIAPNRLIAKGMAYLAPVAGNTTEADKALNRRVELVEQ